VRSRRGEMDTAQRSTVKSAFAAGSGKSHSLTAALSELSPEWQRFALLLVQAVEHVADEAAVPEADVRRMIYRMFQAAVLQGRRTPGARLELAKVLGPSLGQFDPVPFATVEQARRLAALRASLLRDGAWSTAAIAEARGITANNARQWVSRHRKAHRIFTVTHEGETLVPAFLLDEELEPRRAAQDPIRLLHEAGEDGWALWAWFATPSAWVGGRIPGALLASEPDLVTQAARQRAAAAA
jgi:transposase-like protein